MVCSSVLDFRLAAQLQSLLLQAVQLLERRLLDVGELLVVLLLHEQELRVQNCDGFA